jgi:3-methyladenine DNA glycosylase AlkD
MAERTSARKSERKTSPGAVANEIRRALKAGGSPERASSVRRFFKEDVHSRGWRTAELRRAALGWRREILQRSDLNFLFQVADRLFTGEINEEKTVAVFLLENITDKFGDKEFRLLESWLPRISNWSDHDGLVHYLIAPMMVAKPARARRVFRWAISQNRWFRRAACVALIQGARRRMFFSETIRLSGTLLSDKDDMVKKGLGWLLRETAKADAFRTVPHLMSIRNSAPRLVLRTACETLPRATRKAILAVS